MKKMGFKKLFNLLADNIFYALIVTTLAEILANSFLKVDKTIKHIVLTAIMLLIIIMAVVVLLRRGSQKNTQHQDPEVLIQWIEANRQSKDIIYIVENFHRLIERCCEENMDFEIKNICRDYCEKRASLSEFISDLYLYLINNNEDTVKSSEDKKMLGKIYDEFLENIRKKRIFIMNSQNKYVDLNDKKLNKDIQEYEPYLGYWEKSDRWINEKMLKYVSRIRKNGRPVYFLDVGTGNGRVISFLCRENDFVYLVDCDKKRLSEAEKSVSRIIKDKDHLKTLDCRFEKLENEQERKENGLNHYYDIIICSHVIQHNSTEVIPNFFNVLHKLLSSDGYLFLLFPVSKSNKEEYVVHGLEFDVIKIGKEDFLRSIKSGLIDNLEVFLRNKSGFDTLDTQLKSCNDNTGYWKVIKNPGNKAIYEISERKDLAFAYKRVYDKGLICSVDAEYAEAFHKKDKSTAISVINECLCKYSDERVSEKASITENILSEYWLICEIDKKINNNLVIHKNNNQYFVQKAERVIKKHRVYAELLKSGQIPCEFLDFIPDKGNLYLAKDSSAWNISNSSHEKIASIYGTANYYSLVLQNSEKYRIDIDKGDLFLKRVPDIIRKRFFKNKENGADFLVDSELEDGWIINDNGKYFLARYDSDWIRVFRAESVFNRLIEGDLSIKDHNNFPFDLWNEEDICVVPLAEGRIWNVKPTQKEKYTILPNYTILKLNDNDEKYLAYRDKKYNRLSSATFNNLCTQQMEVLRILPTHRFITDDLKRNLDKNGFKVKSQTFYHSFLLKRLFVDKYGLRDKYLNMPVVRWIKIICKKLDIQDCLFIIKKH